MSLKTHIAKTPKYCAELVFEIIQDKEMSSYNREIVKEIVDELYEKGEKEIANKICLYCLGVGFTFLNEIYEKYNQATLSESITIST